MLTPANRLNKYFTFGISKLVQFKPQQSYINPFRYHCRLWKSRHIIRRSGSENVKTQSTICSNHEVCGTPFFLYLCFFYTLHLENKVSHMNKSEQWNKYFFLKLYSIKLNIQRMETLFIFHLGDTQSYKTYSGNSKVTSFPVIFL